MSFTFSPFKSGHTLLDHAAKHLKKLELRAQTFRDCHCRGPFTEVDPATGEICLKFRVIRDPSPEIACLAYDIINEARTALDYAVYDAAAIIQGIAEPSGTKFPFGDDEAKARDDFSRKQKKGRCPPELEDLREFILTDIQPYKGGRGELLVRMNKLRNAKIHRLLVPMAAAFGGMGIGNAEVTNLVIRNEWDADKKELTFARMGAGSKMEMKASVSVAFSQGSDLPGVPVFGVCERILAIVREAVAKIEEKTPELIPA